MTQIALYIDDDAMNYGLISGLRAGAVDVLTVLEAGLTAQGDETQLEFAIQQKRTLYRFNVGDFCRLHGELLSQGGSHAGIIVVVRQRYSVGEQLRRLLRLIATTPAEQMQNRLEFL